MNGKTKCDLSAGLAKIDLTVLRKQTEIHFYSLLSEMETEVANVRNNSLTLEDRKGALLGMASTGATMIQRIAENLAETTELLHTLYNTDEREIEIIR
jgi:hypothetical protein